MTRTPDLARRVGAELLGTALLVTIVVGSGIAAGRLSPDDVGLQLLENSTATFLGLTVLILLFGPVSGAHLNPVVSAADWLLGRRSGTGLTPGEVGAYTVAQVVGAVAGAELANLMYQVPVADLADTDRSGAHLWLGEVVATAGLVALVFALARTGRGSLAAPAVGAYIGAAYWFTSSTSFANPAVTVGRTFSDTFAGIAPGSVAGFVGAQVVGALVAVGTRRLALPPRRRERRPGRRAAPARHRPRARRPPEEHPVTASPPDFEPTGGPPQVVFACIRNSGRSVIGRLLTEHYAAGRVVALSAGTQPGEHIHREVADVLERLGLDTSREVPRLLTRETVAASTVAVTLGCGEECPYVPGVRYVDWPVADPGGQDEATVVADRRRHRRPGPRPPRPAGPRPRAAAVRARTDLAHPPRPPVAWCGAAAPPAGAPRASACVVRTTGGPAAPAAPCHARCRLRRTLGPSAAQRSRHFDRVDRLRFPRESSSSRSTTRVATPYRRTRSDHRARTRAADPMTRAHSSTRHIGLLLFDDVEELDAVGPWEVLSHWTLHHPEDGWAVSCLSRDGAAVTAAKGLLLTPHHSMAGIPPLDVLIHPGGRGTRTLMRDPQHLAWVRAQAGTVPLMTSVCTGALVYAAAGLLAGRPATTHWESLDLLHELDPSIDVAADARHVDDGNVISSADVSAGIDMALHLVARFAGVDRAREVRRAIQYDPRPPV